MKFHLKNNNNDSGNDIDYSVVIGRVSTEDGNRILETLKSLHKQDGDPALEVLLADRLCDNVSALIRKEYPDVHIFECPPGTDLPSMRAEALKYAAGRYILVTEDHCVPPGDWLLKFTEAFRQHPDAAAIGGCVLNGITDTSLDWATFLCEYAHLSPPIEDGPTMEIAGMNVAYRREIFEEIDENILKSGFWETTLHPVLHKKEDLLVADGNVRIFHCKKFSLRLFVRQRFLYSRYFAGTRFPRNNKTRRYFFALMSLALPCLLAIRFYRSARNKTIVREHMVKAIPYLMMFYLVWGVGEAWGYLFGPRDALQQIE